MNTQRLLVTALLLSASVLGAEPIKLKVSDLLALQQGLAAFDGQQKIVPQGDAPAKVALTPYELSGKVRWVIAQDLAALQPQAKAADEARNALLKQIGGDSGTIAATDALKVSKFTAAYNEVLAQVVTVELTKLALADLKLDANPLPPTVLANLSPIITP